MHDVRKELGALNKAKVGLCHNKNHHAGYQKNWAEATESFPLCVVKSSASWIQDFSFLTSTISKRAERLVQMHESYWCIKPLEIVSFYV